MAAVFQLQGCTKRIQVMTYPLNRIVSRSFASVKKPIRLILIGVPGSGKGTQSTKIERDYGSLGISTGQMLRQEISAKSSIGETVQKMMSGGGLVSDDIMLQLIKKELGSEKLKKSGWILDGFPRTVGQASELDKVLDSLHQPLDFIFYLDVPETVIFDRIKERLVHPASGRTYNLSFNPPKVAGKDDITGEPLVKREDDNLDTIRARLKAYHDSTFPMLDFYDKGKRLVRIESPNSVVGYERIKQILDKHVNS
eukprot:TRINITY_DN3893_c0_g1_i1.p1 TRINITY_DN3893_c0_g1~~TRINITY_DN3893_c0_g1_i1.p1  ORF type:complete len:254 (+),score=35.86 TRINITY_DN3893_c0_g1_i1:108-869(+)